VKGAFVVAIFAFVAGCGQMPWSDKVEIVDPRSRLEILEAIFRHQFLNNASGGQGTVAAFCLKQGHWDLPSAFLNRFKQVMPPVRAASACEFREGHYVEKSTGRHALVFYVSELKCGRETCEAMGGYQEGNLSASGNIYRIERRNGSWTVTGDQRVWIS
jgi:hypothetical protein